MDNRIVRADVIISGSRVHGVFFRHFTKKTAKELGLKGWVRNNPDETVECVVEGPENRIKELLIWFKEGPPLASVDKVSVEYEDPRNEFEDFKIV